jgi:FAD/FMN-containing dehydrogenase
VMIDDDPVGWYAPAFPEAPTLVEAAVTPSRLERLLDGVERYRALAGVGYAWVPRDGDGVAAMQQRAASLGGVANLVRGTAPVEPVEPPLPAIQQRIKAAFDPAGVLPEF